MPAPLAFTAPIFIAPLVAGASSIIGIVLALSLAAVSCLLVVELVKGAGRHIPMLRDYFPKELTPEELQKQDAEAESKAQTLISELEAEMKASAQAERQMRLPKTTAEATARLAAAQESLREAQAKLVDEEEAAKTRSGGWHQVAEAREAVERAEAWAAEADIEAKPFRALPSGSARGGGGGGGVSNELSPKQPSEMRQNGGTSTSSGPPGTNIMCMLPRRSTVTSVPLPGPWGQAPLSAPLSPTWRMRKLPERLPLPDRVPPPLGTLTQIAAVRRATIARGVAAAIRRL